MRSERSVLLSRRGMVSLPVWAGAVSAWAATGPVAETRFGKVRGLERQGVQIYRGIPYGGPTEGAGRFLPARAPAKWAGVLDATQNGARSPQAPGVIFTNPRIGPYFSGGRADAAELSAQTDSENCLVLNVLTTGLRGKRPVMVYIHGGGFTGGSCALTAFSDRFVREQDVVLVGVNHRLNVLGYTYLGALSDKYADSGNVGQLDLIAALEWVRDNIGGFGGDAGNVTLFGESGGGAKISALLAMPVAKGLFRRVIIESGSPLRVNDREEAAKAAAALLERCGLKSNQADELQKLPLDRLMAAGAGGGRSVGPVVDGRSIPQQTWEPAAPEVSAGVPMIVGNCKDEATLFALSDEALYSLDEKGLRERLVKNGIPQDGVGPLLALYKRDHPTDTPSDLYFRIASARGARRNAVAQAERRLAQGKADVYMYHFEWNTPLVDGKLRAFHTAELPLAMRLVQFPESEELSRQIAGAWAAFARTGNPNHDGMPAWPKYSVSQRATMLFDAGKTKTRPVEDPDGEERAMLLRYPSGGLL